MSREVQEHVLVLFVGTALSVILAFRLDALAGHPLDLLHVPNVRLHVYVEVLGRAASV